MLCSLPRWTLTRQMTLSYCVCIYTTSSTAAVSLGLLSHISPTPSAAVSKSPLVMSSQWMAVGICSGAGRQGSRECPPVPAGACSTARAVHSVDGRSWACNGSHGEPRGPKGGIPCPPMSGNMPGVYVHGPRHGALGPPTRPLFPGRAPPNRRGNTHTKTRAAWAHFG